MRTVALLLCLFLCLSLGAGSLSEKYQQFRAYAAEFNKRYQSKAVEYYRFAIYLKNLAEIALLNADPEDNAIYGESIFTDLTHAEVK